MRYFAIAMFLYVSVGSVQGAPAQEKPRTSDELNRIADKAHLRGDYEEAVRILSQALDQNTAFHEALLRRATALRIMGKYKEAAADFEVILHLTPQRAWQGYAELLATCPDKEIRDAPRAIKLATQALKWAQARFPKSQGKFRINGHDSGCSCSARQL